MSRLILADEEVHLWRLELDTGDEQHAALLDETERARGARFRREMHRRRYLAAHVGLRRALARYVECTPAELEFQASATDKPALVDADGLEFNLSHSGEHALVAVTRAGVVGVDVEVARVLRDLEALAERNFAPEETGELLSLPEYERPAAFFELVLGKRLKYSSAYYPVAGTTLDEVEEAMLALTCERAQLHSAAAAPGRQGKYN